MYACENSKPQGLEANARHEHIENRLYMSALGVSAMTAWHCYRGQEDKDRHGREHEDTKLTNHYEQEDIDNRAKTDMPG